MIDISAHKKDLIEKGFTCISKVLDPSVISKTTKLTEDIITHCEKNLEDPFSDYFMRHRDDQGALYDLYYRHPEFQKLASNDTILDIIESVVGSDIFLYENSLVYKPKNKNNEVPWHQDFMNRPKEPRKYIAWIALDNVTIESGAMKVIPGSHKNGFLPFHTVEGETHHTRLNLDGVDTSKFEHATLNAGDVFIFDQLLLHSSDRIASDLPRRAYRVAYQGFEQVSVPRSVPIVLRGGKPNALAEKFPNEHKESIAPRKNIVKRIAHSIGYRLMKL